MLRSFLISTRTFTRSPTFSDSPSFNKFSTGPRSELRITYRSFLIFTPVSAGVILSSSSKYCQYTEPHEVLEDGPLPEGFTVSVFTVMLPILPLIFSLGIICLKYPVPASAPASALFILYPPRSIETVRSSLSHSVPRISNA